LKTGENFINFSEKNKKFLYSDSYLILVLIIGALGFIFKLEKLTIIILLVFASYNLIVVKDCLPDFLLLTVIAMVPLTRYAEEGYFLSLKYAVPFVIVALIIHFILYPPKAPTKRFLLPTIAVAISITLGGLFSSTFRDSFKMPALYYVLTLGIGMVGIYLFFESYTEHGNENTGKYFAKMMATLGTLGVIMVVVTYLKNRELLNTFGQIQSKFQFGNNLSNNLLLTMPFTFYLATREKNSVLYFILGILQYLAMIFSLSRGGMLASTIMFPVVLGFTLYYGKKDRLKFLISLFVIVAAVSLTIFYRVENFVDHMLSQIKFDGEEARVNLYKLAWTNFLKYPFFGTGLGFTYPDYYHPQAWCIYWYHSTLFQILGSLGILGILAYGYQYLIRLKTVFVRKDKFNLYVLLSFIGFEGYSLVNVGNFAPLPFVVMLIVMFLVLDRNNEKLLNI